MYAQEPSRLGFSLNPANWTDWPDWMDPREWSWDAVSRLFKKVDAAGRVITSTGEAGQNAVQNVSNATSWRLDGKTVLYGALAIGAALYLTRRRSNPRGRRRRSRRR